MHNYIGCFFVWWYQWENRNLCDVIDSMDSMLQGVCKDPNVENKHGECLIDFLIESK